jgi:uncharacterized protein YktA (UPF0223 family)
MTIQLQRLAPSAPNKYQYQWFLSWSTELINYILEQWQTLKSFYKSIFEMKILRNCYWAEKGHLIHMHQHEHIDHKFHSFHIWCLLIPCTMPINHPPFQEFQWLRMRSMNNSSCIPGHRLHDSCSCPSKLQTKCPEDCNSPSSQTLLHDRTTKTSVAASWHNHQIHLS